MLLWELVIAVLLWRLGEGVDLERLLRRFVVRLEDWVKFLFLL